MASHFPLPDALEVSKSIVLYGKSDEAPCQLANHQATDAFAFAVSATRT